MPHTLHTAAFCSCFAMILYQTFMMIPPVRLVIPHSIHVHLIMMAHLPGAVGGSFGLLPASGFDPFFFMHHAQMDRLFDLWLARHSNIWVQPMFETTGSFYSRGGLDTGRDGMLWTGCCNDRCFGFVVSYVRLASNCCTGVWMSCQIVSILYDILSFFTIY